MSYWENLYKEETKKDYMKKLVKFVNEEYRAKDIYPKKEEIFTALKLTTYEDTKVVILGQDPYHGEFQAHGLSFSILSEKAKVPPSLINIFKELENDIDIKRTNNNLSNWAAQGVLLLNTVLTVEKGRAGSHRGRGWEEFTDRIILELNKKETPVIFVLWGADARSKKKLITNPLHKFIESVHPSPLSSYRGFFGSTPFSKINKFCKENEYSEVSWG